MTTPTSPTPASSPRVAVEVPGEENIGDNSTDGEKMVNLVCPHLSKVHNNGDALRLEAAKKAAKDRRCNYTDYLKLDQILSAQVPQSGHYGHPQHDEMLFIIMHQSYELWFKQILFEIDAVLRIFCAPSSCHDAGKYLIESVRHLNRACEVMKLLLQQLSLLETMTPMNFLGFRDFIDPASGFQSSQFRILENRLGLDAQKRYSYQCKKYVDFLHEKDREAVLNSQHDRSLFDVIENWLHHLPLSLGEEGDNGDNNNNNTDENESSSSENPSWNFLSAYRYAIKKHYDSDIAATRKHFADDEEFATAATEKSTASRDRILNDLSDDHRTEQPPSPQSSRRLSFKSLIAALMIVSNRNEKEFEAAARVIDHLVDLDLLLATWRFKHSLLVQRMLGNKPGTGGSAGCGYLRGTIERCRIFTDFVNVSSLLVPLDAIPPLPLEFRKKVKQAIKAWRGEEGERGGEGEEEEESLNSADLEPSPLE